MPVWMQASMEGTRPDPLDRGRHDDGVDAGQHGEGVLETFGVVRG